MDLNKFYQELDAKFKTSDIKEVEQFVKDSFSQAQQNTDFAAVIAIANELGGIYRVTNRTEEGKRIYQIAIEALKLIGLENTLQHGTTLLNLASVYSEGKDYSEALRLYLQVAQIFEKEGLSNDYRMAALYNNISHVYEQLHEGNKAIEHAEKSLNIIKGIPNATTELATTHTTLACRYINNQRYKEAEENLLIAKRIFLGQGSKLDVHYAATLTAMGELYYHEENYPLAAKYFEQSLDLLKQNYGENRATETVRKNLEQVYQKMAKPLNTEPTGVSHEGLGNLSNGVRKSGLELSEAYYNTYGRSMLSEKFPEYQQFAAVGLVGEGSECLGFDDIFSEDHDFGPGFCIWLPDDIFQKVGHQMQQAYNFLPKSFENKNRVETLEGSGRIGVFSITEFYKKYIGKIPQTNLDWLMLPETTLCTITNGKVFTDPSGQFTAQRNQLLQFYPKDVFLKKLVARLATMAQSGQYNYERCMKRGDNAAAFMACSEFVKAATSAVYLLNRKYMPFYKWMFRGMDQLTILPEIKRMLERLVVMQDITENTAKKVLLIEEICILVRKELNHQGISAGTDDFLHTHCASIMNTISDPQIRNLPALYDVK